MCSFAARGTSAYYVATQVYVWTLLFMYLSSTLCHSFFMLELTGRIFTALDHCSIFFLIAGSFTPFMSVTLGHSMTGVLSLYASWITAFVGVVLTLREAQGDPSPIPTVWLALMQGWESVFALPPLVRCLPRSGVALLAGGGLFYCVGIYFYIKGKTIASYHSIWHIAVLIASTCHFVCIFLYVGETCDPAIANVW